MKKATRTTKGCAGDGPKHEKILLSEEGSKKSEGDLFLKSL